MEQQISWYMKVAMDKSFPMPKMELQWHQMCELVEKLRPKAIVKTITWIKPQIDQIKINSDSYFEHNGKVGIDDIARDDKGNFLFVFAAPVQCKEHNSVEVMAGQFATKWLKNIGYTKGIVEIDSLMIVNMMKEKTSNNIDLKVVVEDSTNLIDDTEISFSHCYRSEKPTWCVFPS